MSLDNLLVVSLENAFVSLVSSTAVGLGANVFAGHSSATKTLPCVVCSADGSSLEEDPPHSGNFWMDFQVAIKASAATEQGGADPNIIDQALTAAVFALVKVNNLDSLLNAQGQNLTVFPTAFFFGAPKSGRDGEGVWVDELPIKIYCCATVIAP